MVVSVALLAVAAMAQEASATGDLVVLMPDLEVQTGILRLHVFDDPAAFPKHPEAAVRALEIPVRSGAAQARFAALPHGTYAVDVYHDENGNGRLDTTLLGVPSEGVGASNDAKGFMGPPKFDAAAFALAGPEVTITIHLAY